MLDSRRNRCALAHTAAPTICLLALLSLWALLPPLSPELTAQETDPRIAAVEEGLAFTVLPRGREPEHFTILERLAHYHVPGVSIAVLDGGRIAWARGYGVADANTGAPVTTETLFQAASVSKPVAATAALRLVEQGVLELDFPVNQYLTSWTLPENNFTREAPVTLRHLLTHTGGLTVHGFPGYAVSDEVASTIQVLDGSGPANSDPIRVDTLPGSLWRYSGGGYTIMQQLLEEVTGQPFPQILRELVLDPAGMELSSFQQPLPPARSSYAATAHLRDGAPVEGNWHIYPEMAAAGLWTNPTELAHLAMELQAAFHGETGRVLSPEVTRAMFTSGLGDWGLGFTLSGEGEDARFTHGGSNRGFKAQFYAYVEGGRGAFIMTNGDQGGTLAREILLAVAREYGWPAPSYREETLAEVPQEILEEIAGEYWVEEEEDLVLKVTVVGDHLRGEVGALDEFELHPTADNFFIDLENGARLRVDRDEQGEVTALQVLGGPRAVRVR